MTRAEGVVDVVIEPVDEPAHEVGIVRLFARIEAEVLHDLNPRHQALHDRSYRRHRVTRIDLALGPAEVAAHHDLGPVGQEPLEGGNADP